MKKYDFKKLLRQEYNIENFFGTFSSQSDLLTVVDFVHYHFDPDDLIYLCDEFLNGRYKIDQFYVCLEAYLLWLEYFSDPEIKAFEKISEDILQISNLLQYLADTIDDSAVSNDDVVPLFYRNNDLISKIDTLLKDLEEFDLPLVDRDGAAKEYNEYLADQIDEYFRYREVDDNFLTIFKKAKACDTELSNYILGIAHLGYLSEFNIAEYDLNKAKMYLSNAYKLGSLHALLVLAKIYLSKEDKTPDDYKKAFVYASKFNAFEPKDSIGSLLLARIYLDKNCEFYDLNVAGKLLSDIERQRFEHEEVNYYKVDINAVATLYYRAMFFKETGVECQYIYNLLKAFNILDNDNVGYDGLWFSKEEVTKLVCDELGKIPVPKLRQYINGQSKVIIKEDKYYYLLLSTIYVHKKIDGEKCCSGNKAIDFLHTFPVFIVENHGSMQEDIVNSVYPLSLYIMRCYRCLLQPIPKPKANEIAQDLWYGQNVREIIAACNNSFIFNTKSHKQYNVITLTADIGKGRKGVLTLIDVEPEAYEDVREFKGERCSVSSHLVAPEVVQFDITFNDLDDDIYDVMAARVTFEVVQK